MPSLTQHQKILITMARGEPSKFWRASDFMAQGMGELFVGYEASARLSDLNRNYPGIFEIKNDGKYRTCRLRREDVNSWWSSLPKYLQETMTREHVIPKAISWRDDD